MATDGRKMIELVKTRAYYGVPEGSPGTCVVKDEEGEEKLKLGFKAHKDYITEIGYEAAPEVSVDICAALASVCAIAHQSPVMTAFNQSEESVYAQLSDDGNVDEENKTAVSIAMAMLKEAVKVYSILYTQKKAQGKDWHGHD